MYYEKQKVIDWAYSQIGYHEKASNSQLEDFTANSGNRNWNKYAAHLDGLGDFYNGPKNIGPDGAWCDIFVDDGFVTCYGRAGAQFLLCQPDKSCGAGCSFSAAYYNSKGQFHKSNPQPGDQIFFGNSWQNIWHTGLVVSVSGGSVTTIEGNSGDMVAKRIYPLNYGSIWGYGRPAWGEKEGSSSAADEPDQPKDNENDPSSLTDQKLSTKTYSVTVPLLMIGDKGAYVKAAQTLLIARGYDCGNKPLFGKEEADGDFGHATERSVGAFQKTHRDPATGDPLEDDGEIGGQTWAALLGEWEG